MNPYNWQSHRPQAEIPRAEVGRLTEVLRNNGSAVVLGGRGMGKSVFLGQLKAELDRHRGTRVVLFEAPPPALTVEACLDALARQLGVTRNPFDAREALDAFFARDDAPERLVLLFDEFDRYAEKGDPSSQPPGRSFFNDLEAARRSLSELGLLAVGSIGIFIFRDVLGSSFLSRALHLRLRPFARADAEKLTGPFAERGSPLSEDVLDALFLASGGIPAILTFGLQQLWALDRETSVYHVTEIFKVFEEEHEAYLEDLLSALQDLRLSDAPLRVWKRIQKGPGRIARGDLESALGEPSGVLDLKLSDALHLLESVGVVRLESSAVHDNPVVAHPIASLLNLSRGSAEQDDLGTGFVKDLTALLGKLHRSSADFFRQDRTAGSKILLPESVFTAHLGLGFELLGWRSEREAQRGAGRTDLLLRRNGGSEVVVLEVKLWGRNDYEQAHLQVESYWTDDVAAGAVVQLTAAELPDWAERYRRECLEPLELEIEEIPVEGSPVRARFRCTSTTAAGLAVVVDHLLLGLPRRC
ncbi:MAG: AAA family ATPase [Thermoanaerobaculia bacterium]